MKALFIADLQLNENEGIYKKIVAEAKGIEEAIGECNLITRNENGSSVLNLLNNNKEKSKKDIFDKTIELITEDTEVMYVRHMIPRFKLLKMLKYAKSKNIKIYYEIPTYPYFGEQFKASKRKYRAIAKILLDIIFLPIIYNYIFKMVIIKSNTNVKKYKKMIEINNGAFVENIKIKEFIEDDNKFSMVTVGTLYPYHGYDRILKGLKECNEIVDGKIVEFNIIGESTTIEELKIKTEEYKLKHVNFLGIKNVNEMNILFDKFNVGLGCLALHRRNANIDTTIKIIEYYCRGITVVTSGISPMDEIDNSNTITVEDSEDYISIMDIYEKYNKIKNINKINVAKKAKKFFSWNNIMKKLFSTNEENI